jgi:diguanylate cyclase (GGDEF)-like protein/PAS domain S-box-containing protein
MKHSVKRHRTRFFDSVVDYMCVLDPDGRFELVNPAFRSLGYADVELLSHPLLSFIHVGEREQTRMAMSELVGGTELTGLECRFQRKDGGWTWLSCNGQPSPSRKLIYLIARDITTYIEERHRLTRLAHHDALTGLANMYSFYDEVSRTIARAQRGSCTPLAILFIDLDGFKPVNDSLGHQAGNRVLQEVATRLLSSVRQADLVARVGGDEFAVLMCGAPSEPKVVAARILKILSDPFVLDGHQFPLSCSIGIAVADTASNIDADRLIRLSDREMYKAKGAGGNRFSQFSI